jgi:hypothetical protein
VERSIDEKFLRISGPTGEGSTSLIEKYGRFKTEVTVGKGDKQRTKTVKRRGWELVESLDSITGLAVTAGDRDNTITAAGDPADPSKPAFDSPLLLDGGLGADQLTGGSYLNWLIGGGIVNPGDESRRSRREVDRLNGTDGAIDIFDLRHYDPLTGTYSDAYVNEDAGKAVISNFNALDGDAIVLAGTADDYNISIETKGGHGSSHRRHRRHNRPATTTIEIQSADTGEIIAALTSSGFTSDTTADDLNIQYSFTADPLQALIDDQPFLG